MDRLLVGYIPYAFQEILKPIMDTEQLEVEQLWEACQKALDNQFLTNADVYGISRWEKILGILPKSSHTLDARRFQVLSRLNQELPYTWNRLRQSLATLCGTGQFEMTMTAPYELTVRLALTSKENLQDAATMAKRMAPANLILVIDLLYNQHKQFAERTHSQMASWSHDQIRKEVLS